MENKSGFTPNGDLVLILPPKVQAMSAGGIAIPDTVQAKEGRATRIGRVIAIGDVAAAHPRMKDVNVGDLVLFPRYCADELPVGDEIYLIMRGESVMGPISKVPTYQITSAISSIEAFGANEQAA